MTSKLIFSNIQTRTVLSMSDIAPSEMKEGRLKAGAAINGIKDNTSLKIDILVVKKEPTLICAESVEFDENDIRRNKHKKPKRITYEYEDISQSSLDKKRLAVGTQFFKGIEPTDFIEIILH